jgi:ABC-type uncharacterized transport system substrate-binding protein
VYGHLNNEDLKMHSKTLQIIFILIFILLPISSFALNEHESYPSSPTKKGSAKWRVGLYTGGEYVQYSKTINEFAAAIIESDWVENKRIIMPVSSDALKDQWLYFSENLRSPYIEFVKDAYWSCGWNDEMRERVKKDCIKKLNEGYVDLVISMGTWAGQDLANDLHSTPVIICSTTDAVGAGILKNYQESGHDHVIGITDPKKFHRQIKLFHTLLPFKKLGVIYHDTKAGKSYANLHILEEMSKELGYELVTCNAVDDIPKEQYQRAFDETNACIRKLVKDIDAMYITTHIGYTENNISNVVDILNENGIPSFYSWGSDVVKKGILFGLSDSSRMDSARFQVDRMFKIFNNATPGKLNQIFIAPRAISINLKTSFLIDYKIPKRLEGIITQKF